MNKITNIICFLLLQATCYGQINSSLNNIPQEKIFLHINTTFLITGNTLNYKVYCINSQTKKLSNLSKVAYVELISETGELITKHKLRLKHGESYGDFYISASISSGNYKIIAYTKWMRNKGLFYEHDLFIVNPFSNNQSKIINKNFSELDSANQLATSVIDNKDSLMSLKTNFKVYRPREKVDLQISALMGEKSFGKYSISVRKKESIKSPELLTSTQYENRYKNKASIKKNVFLIPEFRGELIEGTIIDKQTNKPVSNKNIALSIPGINPLFKISDTNDSGKFFFNVHEHYENASALIYVLENNNSKDYKIDINKEYPIDYSIFKFSTFYISQEDNVVLLKESINNQIEDSYKSVKKNTIQDNVAITPFYGELAKTYYLDDYKRFPTLKETFVEVVDNAWISFKKGNYVFETKTTKNEYNYKLPTLLLIDGMLIENHNDVINYDAKKVEKISILLDRYIYGPIMFDGLISIETIKGDFKTTFRDFEEIQLTKPFPLKNFFSPDYSNPKLYGRVPDYRVQLFWEPNVIINNQSQSLSFYTSDNLGEYVICLEGFTNKGSPVSLKTHITVE